MNLPDNSFVGAVALLITAVVGAFTFRLSQRAAKTDASAKGSSVAIEGLTVLAEQHAKEIERLGAALADCELTKVVQKERIDTMAGQIITLTALTTGAAEQAVRHAAEEAAAAVTLAAENAKTAVDKAAKDAKGAKSGDRS